MARHSDILLATWDNAINSAARATQLIANDTGSARGPSRTSPENRTGDRRLLPAGEHFLGADEEARELLLVP
jgi:hypothetical protein